MLLFIRDNFRWFAAGFLRTLLPSFGQAFFIGFSGDDTREQRGIKIERAV